MRSSLCAPIGDPAGKGDVFNPGDRGRAEQFGHPSLPVHKTATISNFSGERCTEAPEHVSAISGRPTHGSHKAHAGRTPLRMLDQAGERGPTSFRFDGRI